jgi:hypothetical protein
MLSGRNWPANTMYEEIVCGMEQKLEFGCICVSMERFLSRHLMKDSSIEDGYGALRLTVAFISN